MSDKEVDEAEIEGEEGTEEEDATIADLQVYEYVVTYQNGIVRRVWDSNPPPAVLQRWQTQLGRANKVSTLMFPANPNVELTLQDSEGNEVLCPTVLVRADLILDISEVVHQTTDEDDDEDEDEDLPVDGPGGAEKVNNKRFRPVLVPGMA